MSDIARNSNEKPETHHAESEENSTVIGHTDDLKLRDTQAINAKLANPLLGKSKAEIIAEAEAFARENGMEGELQVKTKIEG